MGCLDVQRHGAHRPVAAADLRSWSRWPWPISGAESPAAWPTTRLATMVLARDCPLLVAPATTADVENSPPPNIAQLQSDGVEILGLASGEQVCGEVYAGRMLELKISVSRGGDRLRAKVLAGRKVLMTEAIDLARRITNRSSGRAWKLCQNIAPFG